MDQKKNYILNHSNIDHIENGYGVENDSYNFILPEYNISLNIQKIYQNGMVIGISVEVYGYNYLMRHPDIHREIDQIVQDAEETVENC